MIALEEAFNKKVKWKNSYTTWFWFPCKSKVDGQVWRLRLNDEFKDRTDCIYGLYIDGNLIGNFDILPDNWEFPKEPKILVKLFSIFDGLSSKFEYRRPDGSTMFVRQYERKKFVKISDVVKIHVPEIVASHYYYNDILVIATIDAVTPNVYAYDLMTLKLKWALPKSNPDNPEASLAAFNMHGLPHGRIGLHYSDTDEVGIYDVETAELLETQSMEDFLPYYYDESIEHKSEMKRIEGINRIGMRKYGYDNGLKNLKDQLAEIRAGSRKDIDWHDLGKPHGK